MKTIYLILLLLCCFMATQAQSLRKYPIGNSGCSLYGFCEASYDMRLSEDSSKVYTGECTSGAVTYGVICVQLLNIVEQPDDAEELLVAYLDFLKSNFEITKATGYGKGHRLNHDEQTRGIIDYWEDKEQASWKVKAWTDGKFIGVLYAHSGQELPETKVNVFLDGFRLPQ